LTATEWQSGKVADWQSGRVAEWQSGKVAEWQSGRMAKRHNYYLFYILNMSVWCVWLVVAYNCKMAGLGFDPCLYIFKMATAAATDKRQRQQASGSGIYIYSIFCLFAGVRANGIRRLHCTCSLPDCRLTVYLTILESGFHAVGDASIVDSML
jgi:hypothetical protein